jgi:hypothetical protein
LSQKDETNFQICFNLENIHARLLVKIYSQVKHFKLENMISTLYFWLILAVLLTASNGEPRNPSSSKGDVSIRSSTSRAGELSGCHQVGTYQFHLYLVS